jgi:MarR family transcriptional regulator, organic hydroperoxide resistance regulator
VATVDPLFEFALSVKAIQRELERQMNEAMRPMGLTAAQADALVVIGQAGPLSLKELGELLIAEAGHPSRLIDRLVEAGLVERRAGGEDRRRVELSLSPRGRKLEKRILAARESVIDLARELVGDRDLKPALELLRDLVQLTSFAELIARRRELPERGRPVAGGSSKTRS